MIPITGCTGPGSPAACRVRAQSTASRWPATPRRGPGTERPGRPWRGHTIVDTAGYSDTIDCVTTSYCVDLVGGSWGDLNAVEFVGGTDWITVSPYLPSGSTGTVTSSPPGLACPPTCSAAFADGTAVTLTARARFGYDLRRVGWRQPPTEPVRSCGRVQPRVPVHHHRRLNRVPLLRSRTDTFGHPGRHRYGDRHVVTRRYRLRRDLCSLVRHGKYGPAHRGSRRRLHVRRLEWRRLRWHRNLFRPDEPGRVSDRHLLPR